MNTLIWILQALLATVFLMTGSMKLIQKKEDVLERVGEQVGWVNDFSQQQLYLIGVLEILGALGLVLPGMSGILPFLVPLAGVGLAILMVGAVVTHRRRGETGLLIVTLILALMSVFVAYGRFAVVSL
jgi:uncharacterized membrane protein YphA (DoxX/SURF4 family)